MSDAKRTVVSRRSRPAKDPLSKEIIVQTAFELLQTEGFTGMSMRKIAKALDTGPSSLYVYVTNLQELSAYVLDYGLVNVHLPDAQAGNWKTNLFDGIHAYLKVLYETPGIAELALTTIPVGPHSLAITEYILARFHEGGIHGTAAAWGQDQLLLYATSVAFEQSSRNQRGTTLHAIQASYQSLDHMKYPMIIKLKDELLSGGKERFSWGLEVIVQGIIATQE